MFEYRNFYVQVQHEKEQDGMCMYTHVLKLLFCTCAEYATQKRRICQKIRPAASVKNHFTQDFCNSIIFVGNHILYKKKNAFLLMVFFMEEELMTSNEYCTHCIDIPLHLIFETLCL